MKWLKFLLISVVVLFAVVVAGFYIYIETLPTAPPQFVQADKLNAQAAAKKFSCNQQSSFNYAYRVSAEVEAKIDEQLIYQSTINFDTQLKQANDDVIKAIASQIKIDEGQGQKSLADMYYLSRVSGDKSTVFSAYNDLGLAEKHPMKILSQLLKALSVGEQDKSYFYSYDPSGKTYKYRHKSGAVERASYLTTANFSQLSHTLFNDHKNEWQAKLDGSCVPRIVSSSDRQGFMAGDKGGYIKFTLRAEKTDNYIDLSSHQINANANAGLVWHNQQVSADKLASRVKSEKEMWQVISSFAGNRDVAALTKAADYMIENIAADELASKLASSELSDQEKRDIAFALSLSSQEGAEGYMVDSLNALPSNSGDDNDMQKVRLMVALSGSGQSGDQAFTALNELRQQANESDNIKNNSLINMATLANKQQLQGDQQNSEALEKIIKQELQSDNASSAILAAGNAQLDGLQDEISDKLSSSSEKERYAAATVLSRNADNQQQMIDHIDTENSLLVVNSILSNLNKSDLTSSQIAQLEAVAAKSSNADIKTLIEHKLK